MCNVTAIHIIFRSVNFAKINLPEHLKAIKTLWINKEGLNIYGQNHVKQVKNKTMLNILTFSQYSLNENKSFHI